MLFNTTPSLGNTANTVERAWKAAQGAAPPRGRARGAAGSPALAGAPRGAPGRAWEFTASISVPNSRLTTCTSWLTHSLGAEAGLGRRVQVGRLGPVREAAREEGGEEYYHPCKPRGPPKTNTIGPPNQGG